MIIVCEQIVIICLLIFLGFFGGRMRILDKHITDGMANIVVWFVSPAMVIIAFQREYEAAMMRSFFVTMLILGAAFVVFIALAFLLFWKKDPFRRPILCCGVIFFNYGMIALPLEKALFGNVGVFYGAGAIAIFNLVFWSIGAVIIDGRFSGKAFLKGFLNPGFIGTVIGILLFINEISLPAILYQTFDYISNLNVPLCMLVIGCSLSGSPIREILLDKDSWVTAIVSLIILPVLTVGILWLLNIRGIPGVCCVTAVASPAAASISMMAAVYHKDVSLASRMTSLQVLLSMLTLPVTVSLGYALLM